MRRRWVHHRLRPQPSISGCDGESQLDLHQLDRDLFCAKKRSLWVPPGGRGVFGGQVIGQALHAASLSVDADRACHSLHGLFILPGDPKHDIIYRVGRSSDRRSFASRSVQAVQHGQVIFQAEMSFTTAAADQPALSHQREMPDVPLPESLPSHVELLDRLLPSLPSSLHAAVEKMRSMPVEMRMVDPPDLLELRPPSKPARQYIWMRISQPLGASPGVHRACAAYFSDHALLTTALRPHGINFPSPRLGAVASLDHSMWFHTASFRADEWMLCAPREPSAAAARAPRPASSRLRPPRCSPRPLRGQVRDGLALGGPRPRPLLWVSVRCARRAAGHVRAGGSAAHGQAERQELAGAGRARRHERVAGYQELVGLGGACRLVRGRQPRATAGAGASAGSGCTLGRR